MSPEDRSHEKLIRTPYDDLTYQIIGCSMAAHRNLGPGLREDTYQRDLEARLAMKGISFEAQKLYEIYDPELEGNLLGYYIPDFVVTDAVIVEIKTLRGLDSTHFAQVVGYLCVSACPIGLLINFGQRSLTYRRILPPQKISEHIINRQ